MPNVDDLIETVARQPRIRVEPWNGDGYPLDPVIDGWRCEIEFYVSCSDIDKMRETGGEIVIRAPLGYDVVLRFPAGGGSDG